MADDQVKYSDLISEDVAAGFELLNSTMKELKETMAALKTEATGLGSVIKGMGTATREQQKSISDNAAAVDRLNKRMKDLSDEEQRLEAVSRRYKKLTDEQVKSVDAFQQAMQGTAEEQIKAASAIDVQVKSYNELQATYNALKDTLNAMTTAERESSQAGKVMTTTAMTIRDKMNELQKATGNYTLQVGKYKAAFDGLGFSFMQIAREAPSALNLNQFFLAISNNLPMFFDQIDRFKTEQKEIKQTLADLAAQGKQTSDEYTKIAAQQTTVFKRLATAVFSLQGAVLVFTMILRFLPKIVEWFKKMSNRVQEGVRNLIRMREVINEIDIKVQDAISKAVVELDEINRRLAGVTRGTTDWYNIVARVNEITNNTLDATKAMPDDIAKVTAEYVKQAEQLAKNQFVVEKISESVNNQFKRDRAGKSQSASELAKILGVSPDSDEFENLEEIWDDYIEARDDYQKKYRKRMATYSDQRELYDARNALLRYIQNATPTMTQEEMERLWDKYYKPLATKKETTTKTGSTKEPKDEVADLLTLQRQLEDQIIANIENEYKRLDEEEAKRHERFIQDQEAELAKLAENDPRRAIINRMIENENRTHERKMEEIDEKRYEELTKLSRERLERENKEAADAIKNEEKDFKAKQEIAKRRFDLEKHNSIEQAKFNMEQEIASKQWQIDHAKELQLSEEQLAILKEEVEWLNKKYNQGNYNAKRGNTGNYSNIMDVLFGKKITKDQQSALNSVFDQAKEALNSWMDARKAAADQAKELADDEVSAAENALNREIELRNQGYANNVALRERELADAKDKQRRAMEEQKKIAQEQILLDAAMQTSSLITASANIWKQFSTKPLLALALLGTMWGSFLYSKAKAYQVSQKSVQFREGGVMMLEGGSHESGHDVNLGIGPDGSNLRAEGGEYFAVINKRNSRKYGSEIPAVVNALNSGMFEDRYIKTSDAVGLLPRIIRADNGSEVDLSAVESGVGQLVKQGETSYNVVGDYMEIRYKNRVRRVKIG